MAQLQIEDLVEGTGAAAEPGMMLLVHYTGWLTTGRMFDSSHERGHPFGFRLGVGKVIAGWDQGLVGMKVGGKRRLTVPAALAYGAKGYIGMIPPNADLLFEVELLGAMRR